jgi:polyribonucleotide nucleotidyltransferase
MKEIKSFSTTVGGRELIVETGLLAGQANGSVTVRYGDTVVLATATMSERRAENLDYFPLLVDYEEKYYASGKIKGSRFIKREGRPSDEAVLTGRLIDRTIRPLFDERMRNEVQVVATVLSIDQENDPDVIAIIAASLALGISNIPWAGPVAAVRVGKVADKFLINPINGQSEESQVDLVVSGTDQRINMIEAGAEELPEKEMAHAITFGFDEIRKIAAFQKEVITKIGLEKAEVELTSPTEEFKKDIISFLDREGLAEAFYTRDKKEQKAKMKAIKGALSDLLAEKFTDEKEFKTRKTEADLIYENYLNDVLHKRILETEERPDGRKLDEVRPIECRIGLLPRTHGSGLFTRGETQALTVATLGAPGAEQTVETMETEEKKRYMHHYNFPAYSVGEVRPNRGPGRREIGHGALAERALQNMIPAKEAFPYTIRLVSEVLSSNGSSSMASTCGSTLALMDAGVPIKKPVSGIAMGIIVGNNGEFKVLSDIQGPEDHWGDMDFKIAGTKDGITALQLDVKIDGLTPDMIEAVFTQAYRSRMHIMDIMLKTIATPRKELSPYAPRIITLAINPDKIRDVIGPGGKMINEIIDETGVEIDIEDDGSIFITSESAEAAAKAKQWIENITREVKAGEIFKGKVTRIMNFGAFIEILPKQEGMVHVSEMANYRVNRPDDIVKVGQMVSVKVKEIDSQGRINLSMKDLLPKKEADNN